MKITISKTVKITSPEQWFNCAPPKGGAIQWKPGRSAQEMARFALSTQFPILIENILAEYGIKDSAFTCEPEAETPFENGMGTSGPRNHDLLMLGNDTAIGVEAKVSESFDKQIKEKRIGASKNMHTRLDSCLDFMYSSRPDNAEELYYQLFSATIGTIIEAKKNHFKNAIALFVVFVGNVAKEPNYADHLSINKKAFADFCASFGLDEKGGRLPEVPGAKGIKVWIKKVEVNIENFKF